MVCKLLADVVGYAIQVALTATAFMILYGKYKCEKQKRQLHIWLKDSIKQICGLCIAHIWNVIFAIMLNNNISTQSDECVMYFDNYIFDSTFGTLTTFIFLKIFTFVAKKYKYTNLISGYYPPQSMYRALVLQILSWAMIITIAKWIVFGAIVFPLRNYLSSIGKTILNPVIGYDNFELSLVMIIIPLVFNTIQLIIQDMWIRYKQLPLDLNSELDDNENDNNNDYKLQINDNTIV